MFFYSKSVGQWLNYDRCGNAIVNVVTMVLQNSGGLLYHCLLEHVQHRHKVTSNLSSYQSVGART